MTARHDAVSGELEPAVADTPGSQPGGRPGRFRLTLTGLGKDQDAIAAFLFALEAERKAIASQRRSESALASGLVIFGVILHATPFGRALYAIGAADFHYENLIAELHWDREENKDADALSNVASAGVVGAPAARNCSRNWSAVRSWFFLARTRAVT